MLEYMKNQMLANYNQIDSISQKIASSLITLKRGFEKQIDYLRKSDYESISLNRLIDFIVGDVKDIHLKPVVITFDDVFSGIFPKADPL